jgi:hypothetical protein
LEQERQRIEQRLPGLRRLRGAKAGQKAYDDATQRLSQLTSDIHTLRTRLTPGDSPAERELGIPKAYMTPAQIRDANRAVDARETATRIQVSREHQREGLALAAEKQYNRALTVEEASTMGVPVGTRFGDLAAQGRIPPILREGQAKAYNYGSRALNANGVVEALEATGEFGARFVDVIEGDMAKIVGGVGAAVGIAGGFVGMAGGAAGGAAAGTLAAPLLNTLRTDAQQEYLQAKVDFIASVLRKESGAAITASEYASENKRYFPQPGDKERVIAQKAQARRQVLAALTEEAGRPLLRPQPYTPPDPTPQPAVAPPAEGFGRRGLPSSRSLLGQ